MCRHNRTAWRNRIQNSHHRLFGLSVLSYFLKTPCYIFYVQTKKKRHAETTGTFSTIQLLEKKISRNFTLLYAVRQNSVFVPKIKTFSFRHKNNQNFCQKKRFMEFYYCVSIFQQICHLLPVSEKKRFLQKKLEPCFFYPKGCTKFPSSL